MQSNLKQLSLTDIYTDLDECFHQDKPMLIRLFDHYIDLSELIPQSFINHYYASTGHTRKYKLSSMIKALIIKMILSIDDISLLINVLIPLNPRATKNIGKPKISEPIFIK
ncbi:hypothetical protein [Clostridium estertheticum]|uniref:hypothetical protein n=1 Tax=Clostridium estertheticum TaxID=238834 RepID=UPI001C6E6C4B|nr:hypothetical protein [Clostridium estertheticum]MBW9154572.1 hypothetical protein [Clostridium estertheticum]WLC83813.1 hypothetical protein KTC97_17415 [Clostridium estertheticum]